MIRGLIYLDENLASSIALRYASHLSGFIQLQLQTMHVEESDQKQHSAGSGWVRRSWEKGLADVGFQTVERLLKTENVQCPFVGQPKVFVGKRDDEILAELRTGGYDLFLEGNLSTTDVTDFYRLVSSRLYRKAPCPVMIIKNMLGMPKVALLCGDGVDQRGLISQFLGIIGEARLDFELIYYKFQEMDSLVLQENSAADGFPQEAESLLLEKDKTPGRSLMAVGTPEQLGGYLRNYGLVASTFPTRKSPGMEALAHTPSTVLLCK